MQIGPYDVLSRIGEGGMGEVYRARDPRLNREVAIKLLHAESLSSPDRLARFEAEARAASALNHPNILTIHDIGETDGKPFLISELIEGETLRAIIDRGPVSAKRLLDIAVQVADGLAAGHAAGIVHRDLKPENIMFTKDGRVKILDFGLAKLDADHSGEMATMTNVAGTQPGAVLGTVGYMSPEQARGDAADYRSDQFAFGLILHEMATGERTFRRASQAETMTAIIREEAAPLDASFPAPLRWTIDRLLAKDPDERFASTRDLYRDLRNLREHLSEASSGTSLAPSIFPAGKHKLRTALLAIACLAAGSALAIVLTPASRPDLSAYRFIPFSREEPSESAPQWAPDGKSIAYSVLVHGISQIYTRSVGAASPAQITRAAESSSFPFWSPDGSKIYFRRENGLWVVPASGGIPQLALANAGAATIHPDGKTVAFTRAGKLWIASLEAAQQQYLHPAYPADGTVNALQFALDGSKIAVTLSLPSAPGRWAIWIIPYPSGTPRRLERTLSATGFKTFTWYPDNRRLLYPQVDANDNTQLIALDVETNRARTIFTSPLYMGNPSISADGKRVVMNAGLLEWDLVEIALADAKISPLLTRGGVSYFPDWAPSGTHYLLVTNTRGSSEIEDRAASEGFTRELISLTTDGLSRGMEWFSQPRWAPDGERFVFSSSGSAGHQLWVSNVAGSRPVTLDLQADLCESPAWSPDGQWVAYLRQKNGKYQLAKRQPGVASSLALLTKADPASDRLYTILHWSPDGRSILYPSREGLGLISADGESARQLTTHKFASYGFTRDGRAVVGILRSDAPDKPEWQLVSVDVATGADRIIGTLDLPSTVNVIAGFSLHPKRDRFATSISRVPWDIWTLEGFDEQKSWRDRLLRR